MARPVRIPPAVARGLGEVAGRWPGLSAELLAKAAWHAFRALPEAERRRATEDYWGWRASPYGHPGKRPAKWSVEQQAEAALGLFLALDAAGQQAVILTYLAATEPRGFAPAAAAV